MQDHEIQKFLNRLDRVVHETEKELDEIVGLEVVLWVGENAVEEHYEWNGEKFLKNSPRPIAHNRKHNKEHDQQLLSRHSVKIHVTWSKEPLDLTPPPAEQEIPQDIYDRGYKDETSVPEYLTEKTGWLVEDWKYADVLPQPVGRITYTSFQK